MAWRVDEVQFVFMAVPRGVIQRDALGLNGDAPLSLQIHGVQHLFGHLPFGQTSANLDKTVCNGGFAMVDVGDYGEITDSAQFSHRQ